MLNYLDHKFTYKGHLVHIHHEHDYDDPTVVKAYYNITRPDGTNIMANISPYEDNPRKATKMFIDLGYPYKRYNWNLQELIQKQERK